MALKDLKLPEERIEIPGGGSFAVRGLSFVDVAFLVREHKGEVEKLYAQFQASDGDDESLDRMIEPLVATLPNLAASIIACATDDVSEASLSVSRRLPFTVQIEALRKVFALTVEAEGGVKKLVETVISIARGAREVTSDLTLPIGLPQSGAR